MTDLYLLFFIVGVILFAAVVGYSWYQQKRRDAVTDDFIEPKRVAESEAERVEPSLSASLNASKEVPTSEPLSVDPEGLDSDLDLDLNPDASRKVSSKVDGRSKSQSNLKQSADSAAKTNSSPASAGTSAFDRAKSAMAKIKKSASSAKTTDSPGGVEPSTTPVSKAGVANADPVEAKVEPSLDTSSVSHQASQPNAKSLSDDEPTKVFSDDDSVVTDLVARVLNPKPIEQSDLLSLFREHDYKFSRKVHIYGLNELTDMWRDIEFELPSARFLELGISIQLCDREGAMSEKEGHHFHQMVLQFCERYDAPFEFSVELDAALKQAQALDQVGRRYDSMAVLNVVPRSKAGFRIADIQSCARDLMMSTDKNGIFMKTEGQKNNITVLYRLACTDGEGHFGIRAMGQTASTPVYDLVVYMNVPATRDPEIVFQQMVKDANDLATWLDGKVVDRAGKAMTQRTYSTLMQQISDIAYSMQQDGLVPGDAVAKKLF